MWHNDLYTWSNSTAEMIDMSVTALICSPCGKNIEKSVVQAVNCGDPNVN